MILNLKGLSELVSDMTAALQGSASAFVDVSVGSVLRAVFEANAAVALWLQWLILKVLQTTRAATSTGTDLDTWMNDFGLVRLPATAATGVVTFSRFSNNLPALIPVGAVVKTTDGTLSFAVMADTTLSTWQAASGGYAVPSGVTSATLPVSCLTSGFAGNVLANAISLIASSLPGIDQVSNGDGLTNGSDAETDAAFRLRFQNYLSSLSKGTLTAIQNTIASVRQNLKVLIQENTDAAGAPLPGSFLVTLDDGSGYPPSSLLSSVASAVEAVRPIGTRFTVLAPQVLTVNVQLSLLMSNSSLATQIVATTQQLIIDYLDSLPIGATASITRIGQIGYAADSSISNITGINLNGQGNDLTPSPRTVIKAGQITVTVNGG